MKTNKLLLTGSIAGLSTITACSSINVEEEGSNPVNSNPDKPNIIFVLVDDLGKEWVNCYGAEGIETPNIDKLAVTGMKFNNAYSMPQCTPSRACFMSGQYPYRNGWVNHWDSPRWGVGYYDWNRNPSIGTTMKSAGYKTAIAGKWQLNDFRIQPDVLNKLGFDDYCMWTGYEGGNRPSGNRYWDPYIHTKKGSKTYKGKFGPDIYNQFLLDFISKNKEESFFIYYPMALTHTPFVHTPHEMEVKDKVSKHKAMVRYTDFLLGKIVKHLDDLGIRKNTIIIWTTDNGTCGALTNNLKGRNVRGGKTKTTENGVNAPFIVNCPGLVPEGVVSNALVDFTDMMPTFADFAGTKLDMKYKYDGVSLKDVFTGKKKKSGREYILAMGSHPAKLSEKGVENTFYFRDRVVRGPRYKLFIGTDRKPVKLVDLEKDLDEKINLIDNPEYKDILEKLTAIISTLPVKDNDPNYETLPPNAWDKKPWVKSQIHKIGHPDNPVSNPPKQRKKRRNKSK